MLCERPKVHFGGTQEWSFQESETHIGRNSLTKELTKDNDGPNEYTIFKGKIISGFILKEYTDAPGMAFIHGQDTMDALGEYLERDIEDTLEYIQTHGTCGCYYQGYKFTKKHIPHLNVLKDIIHVMNLDSRIRDLLDQVAYENASM